MVLYYTMWASKQVCSHKPTVQCVCVLYLGISQKVEAELDISVIFFSNRVSFIKIE